LLEGKVRARCGRYRLRADRLQLHLRDGGLDVDGPAQVLLCPCDDAPVAIGFEGARVDPPSDLLLYQPSARIGGTTVLGMPALWLRAPDRPGLLVPRLAWRGDDGLLAGPGLHLPWRDDHGNLSVLRLYVSGYSSGGIEIEPTLVTSATHTRVRYDRTRSDLLSIESDGAAGDDRAAVLAWSVDVARGQRARTGLVDILGASRQYDDLRAHVAVRKGWAMTVSTGVDAAGRRAASEPLAFGPVASLQAGDSVANVGAWQAGASMRLIDEASTTFDVLAAQARVDTGWRWGPLGMRAAAIGRARSVMGPDSTGSQMWASSVARASVPLARRYGSGGAAMVHFVNPYVSGQILGIRERGDVYPVLPMPPALGSGARWVAKAGTRSAVGQPGTDRGSSLDWSAGYVGPIGQERAAVPLLAWKHESDLGWLAIASEAALVRRDDRFGFSDVAYLRIGADDSSHVRLARAYRSRVDTLDATVLWIDEGWGQGAWLDRDGSSLVPGAKVDLTAGFSLSGDTWLAWPGDGYLGARGGVGYHHPCGCLEASLRTAHRIGRRGADVWLSIDLAP